VNFYDRLRNAQRKNNSLLCIGLDPDAARIPKHLLSHPDAAGEFCRQIVGATGDIACAYKLNLAFFESMGERGWATVHSVLASIPPHVLTIGDAKRGDIGNTAEMYAKSLLDDYKFGSTTVNPYLGTDSIAPFITNPERGAFVLALTSNPGAKDFQYLTAKGKPLYKHVVARSQKWNALRNIGLVVGATRPVQLKEIRRLVPEMPLLIPGVGAQGGDVKLAVRNGCDREGLMAVVNSSRGILYASAGEDFAGKARLAALALRDEMNRYRDQFFS
jgi:orotidine-5'-phosphate decarboxylase